MLIMRVEAQPYLDKMGLAEAHIEVIDRKMVIVGECSEPLISVKGIQFSKSTINGKEREIAIELLSKFLTKNKKDIDNYIAAKKAQSKLICPTTEDLEQIAKAHGFKIENSDNLYIMLAFSVEKVFIRMYKNGSIDLNSIDDVSTAIKELLIAEGCIIKLQTVIAEIREHERLVGELYNLRNSLGSCSI